MVAFEEGDKGHERPRVSMESLSENNLGEVFRFNAVLTAIQLQKCLFFVLDNAKILNGA